MSTVEKKLLQVIIVGIGKFYAEFPRINAPITIQQIMKSLPVKGRGLLQDTRLTIPTSLRTRPEKPRSNFNKGDISLDSSSGNLSIYLNSSEITGKETYLGSIIDELPDMNEFKSTAVIIREDS